LIAEFHWILYVLGCVLGILAVGVGASVWQVRREAGNKAQ